MHKTALAFGLGRNPERGAPDTHAFAALFGIANRRETRGDSPGRIVGRCADHTHIMTGGDKRRGHVGGVAADPCELRCVVDAVDKNLHRASRCVDARRIACGAHLARAATSRPARISPCGANCGTCLYRQFYDAKLPFLSAKKLKSLALYFVEALYSCYASPFFH